MTPLKLLIYDMDYKYMSLIMGFCRALEWECHLVPDFRKLVREITVNWYDCVIIGKTILSDLNKIEKIIKYLKNQGQCYARLSCGIKKTGMFSRPVNAEQFRDFVKETIKQGGK